MGSDFKRVDTDVLVIGGGVPLLRCSDWARASWASEQRKIGQITAASERIAPILRAALGAIR